MCRRNLAENASPGQQATEQQIADAARGVQEFERATGAMRNQMASLGQFLHSIGAGADFDELLAQHLAGTLEDEESSDEDRHEFSGMYS